VKVTDDELGDDDVIKIMMIGLIVYEGGSIVPLE
jgi:hypothetical protein